jgi:Fe-Mn family superoxide dismutase
MLFHLDKAGKIRSKIQFKDDYLFFSAELKQAIARDFGSLENLQNQLTAASVAVPGSGWVWLGYNRQTNRLQLATTINNDLLEPTHGKYI